MACSACHGRQFLRKFHDENGMGGKLVAGADCSPKGNTVNDLRPSRGTHTATLEEQMEGRKKKLEFQDVARAALGTR